MELERFDWSAANIQPIDSYFLLPMQQMSLACLCKNIPVGTRVKASVLGSEEVLKVRDHRIARIYFEDGTVSEWFTAVDAECQEIPQWVDGHFLESVSDVATK